MGARECLSKFLGIFVSLVLFNVLMSCSGDFSGNWYLYHTVGEITKDRPSYSWYQISSPEEEEKFIKFLSAGLQEKIYMLPSDSVAHQRLNYWISLIDSTLRKKYPDKFNNVPTPRVLVSDSSLENAFVNTVPVCYNVPVVMEDEASNQLDEKDPTSLLFVPKKDGGIGPISLGNICQKAKDESDETVSQIIRDISRTHSNCPIELKRNTNGKRYIKLGKCGGFDESHFKDVKGYNSFVITATPNVLVVLSGLLEATKDEAFNVSILAHEVSHYYRAHLDVFSETDDSDYDFIYQITEQNLDKRPDPTTDSNLENLGKKATKIKTIYYDIARIKDQMYRSEIFDTVMTLDLAVLANQRCENENDCNNSCKQFLDWFRVMTNHSQWSFKFPVNVKMSKENVNQYLEFEKLSKACLEKVKVGENPEQIKKGFEIHPDKVKRSMGLLDNFVDDKYFENQTFTGSIPDILSNAQNVIEQYLANQNKVLNEAYDNRVGVYTKEQEADELSVEILHEIGFDLKKVVETYLFLSVRDNLGMELFNQEPIPHSEGFLNCLELYNKGWKKPDGSHYFVGVSNYRDPHHSSCYRVYNIDKEISAHKEYKEVVNIEKKAFLTIKEYEDMLTQVKEFRAKNRNGNTPIISIGDIIIIP